MNSQWMTTLLSKGIELEQSLRKGFEGAQTQLKKELETRGIKLSAADLAALVEDIAPPASRAALSGALDFVRPFTAGMGLRVARISDTQIEIVIPPRARNLDSEGRLHDGALIAAGVEAAKLLWTRHAPLGRFDVETRALSLDVRKPAAKIVRARLELNETARETALAQLRRAREASSDIALRFVDEDERSVADMTLSLKLSHTPALENPTE